MLFYKEKITSLVCCIFLALAPVAFIFYTSRTIQKQEDFYRVAPPHSLDYVRALDLPQGHYSFAGTVEENIFLTEARSPILLFHTATALSKLDNINLAFADSTRIYDAQTCVTDKQQVFIFDGYKPSIMETILPKTQMNGYFLQADYYLKALPLSAHSFVFERYDTLLAQNIFLKYNLTDRRFQSRKYIPDKQGDGIFSIDGRLQYDPKNNRLIYLYYYKNQFDCLDTNLQRLYTGKTLDSNHTAKLKIMRSGSGNIGHMMAGARQVNKEMALADNRLYVQSLIPGKNESIETMKTNDIIDVYSVSTGDYIQTLKAEKYKGRTLEGFVVIGDLFIGLYGNSIVGFSISRIRSDR